jgi:hypothetical protein
VLPLSDAVTLAVPAATPVIVNVAVEDPAAALSGDETVSTAGLLLVNVMLAAVVGAAVRVTVPGAVLPIPIVGTLSVTPDTVGPVVVGDVGVLELPHPPTASAADTAVAKTTRRDWLSRFIIHG